MACVIGHEHFLLYVSVISTIFRHVSTYLTLYTKLGGGVLTSCKDPFAGVPHLVRKMLGWRDLYVLTTITREALSL